MTPTFKGYHKKATSDTMMRIIKRERILSIIIAGRVSGHVTLERTNPTTPGMRRSSMPWHDRNKTTMTICHQKSEEELFNWKVGLINGTGWLYDSEPKQWEEDGYLYASWSDTRKLRIFYDWLHRNKEFSVQRVLKYMYSPLFLLAFQKDGLLVKDPEHGYLLTHGFPTKSMDSELIALWMKQILSYTVRPFNDEQLVIETSKVDEHILEVIQDLKNT